MAHCLLGASPSAGHLDAFFLFVFLRCGSGSCPLVAPAFSGCVPPAARGKSRISKGTQNPKGHDTAVLILEGRRRRRPGTSFSKVTLTWSSGQRWPSGRVMFKVRPDG